MEILSKSKNKLVYKKGNKVYKQFYDIDLYYSELYIFKIKEIQSIIPRLIDYDNKKLLLIVEYIYDEGCNVGDSKKIFLIGKTLKTLHLNNKSQYYKLVNDNNKIYFNLEASIIKRIEYKYIIDKKIKKYIRKYDLDIVLNIRNLQFKNFIFSKNKVYMCDFDEFEFSNNYISIIDFFTSNTGLTFYDKKEFLRGYGGIKDKVLFNIYLKYINCFIKIVGHE